MKNLNKLISLLIIFFSFNACAQNLNKDKIAFIKAQYTIINHNLSSYQKVTRNDGGQTTEGGEVNLYSAGTEIKKISTVYYGETGKINEEYYFFDNRLIFYYSLEENYKQPISIAPKVIVSKKQESRYYFNDGVLIKYIYNPIKQMSNDEIKKTEIETQTETKRLLSLFTIKA
ncbi:hypothetical protein [Mucilaginibacter sp.]